MAPAEIISGTGTVQITVESSEIHHDSLHGRIALVQGLSNGFNITFSCKDKRGRWTSTNRTFKSGDSIALDDGRIAKATKKVTGNRL